MGGKLFFRSTLGRSPSARQRGVMCAALALLAATAVALSGVALLTTRADRAGDDPASPPSFGANSPGTKSPPTVSETPAPPASMVAAPDRILAVGARDGHLVRGTTGTCGTTAATLDVSSDGGTQWRGASLTDLDGGELLALDAGDPSVTRMVYLGGDCSPELARSFVGGADWEPTTGVEASWFLHPAEPVSANSPGGRVQLPCGAVSLDAAAERGIVLCEDARIAVTSDFGTTWSAPVAVADAVAVALSGSGFAIAVESEGECRGIQAKRFVDGRLGEGGACLEGEFPESSVVIAGSPHSSVLYAWAGDVLARSEDGGSSWI